MAARPEKVAVVDDVKGSLDEAIATILTDYRGLSVGDLAELRAELRKVNATYKVAKNTLMRRAAAAAEIDIEDLLVGPTALVFCEDDPVGPAKALKAFAKDHPELIVKGSWFDGERLDAEATVKLAELQSREELLTTLAGLMHGALANTARLLNAAPTKFAQLLAALEAEGGPGAKGFEPTDAPAAGADADDTPETAEDAPADDTTPDTTVADDAADDEPAADAESSDEAEVSDEVEAEDDDAEASAEQPDADAAEAEDQDAEASAEQPDADAAAEADDAPDAEEAADVPQAADADDDADDDADATAVSDEAADDGTDDETEQA